MSINWGFYSYNSEYFNRIFGNATEEEVNEIIELSTWELEDMGQKDDINDYINIVKEICKNGISYASLDTNKKECLDHIIWSVFSSEGIPDKLNVVPESDEFIHPSVIDSILNMQVKNNVDLSLEILSLFKTGRRLDGTIFSTSSEYPYLILSVLELHELEKEIIGVLSIKEPWPEDWQHEFISENILKPVKSISNNNKHLYAQLS